MCPILGLFVIPMTQKRHLWPTDLTPVNFNGSKKFLREDVLSHALYHPTKFQPDPSSHIRVYKRQTTGILFTTQGSLASLARLGSNLPNTKTSAVLCMSYGLRERERTARAPVQLGPAAAAAAAAAEEDDAGRALPLHGLLYAAALVGLGFLGSLAETHSFFQLNLAGMKAKTALTSAIFRKSLNMKHPRGKVCMAKLECHYVSAHCQPP